MHLEGAGRYRVVLGNLGSLEIETAHGEGSETDGGQWGMVMGHPNGGAQAPLPPPSPFLPSSNRKSPS